MIKENKTKNESEAEIVKEENFKEIMPSMTVGQEEDKPSIVSDEQLMGIYGEIMTNVREDRQNVNELLATFVDMVLNGGDATTSSKEAVVNLLKIKTDLSDKMSKIADLMTRVKLKESDTFPKYLAASQTNNISITDSGRKRALLEAINKENKKNKEGQ